MHLHFLGSDPYSFHIENNEISIEPNKEIFLYIISLDLVINYVPYFLNYLSLEEKVYANSYRTQDLANSYIISRTFLRKILSHHTKLYASQLDFTVGPYGKPYLKNCKDSIQFNISHAKNCNANNTSNDA